MFTGSCRKARPNSFAGKGNDVDVFIGLDVSLASTAICVLGEKGKCAVVSIAAVTPSLPAWIEDWNPRRIFCAYDATPGGDDAAERLFRRDSRVVRVRPALDGDDWNDMRRRDLEGNMFEIDDRLIS